MKFTTKQLSYEDILQYVSEEDIAMFYLGVGVKSTFYSFFREESNPGRYLYYKKGRMHYFDCFESRSLPYLIMELNHWSYREFIDHLKTDLLNKVSTTSQKKNPLKSPIIDSFDKKTILQIKSRPFEDYDILGFWGLGGITLNWLRNPKINIKAIEYFWINNYLNVAEKYAYSYEYYQNKGIFRRKVYQPYSTDNKWISNVNSTIVQGWNTIPKSYDNELLIITSSYKDVGTIECNLKIPSIAPNSETAWLPEYVIEKINQRYKRIITWFDQDLGGHKGANRYEAKYGYKPVFIPEGYAKDPFAFRSKFGYKEFLQMSNYIIYEK